MKIDVQKIVIVDSQGIRHNFVSTTDSIRQEGNMMRRALQATKRDNELHKALTKRKNFARKVSKLINWLLENNRCTKDEIHVYLTPSTEDDTND